MATPQIPQDPPVLAGHPGDAGPAAEPMPPAPPPAPTTRKVHVAGREYELPPEAIEAIEEQRREAQQKLSEQANELGELRKWRRQMEQVVSPQPPQVDLATLMFANPQEFTQKILQTAEERATERMRREVQPHLQQAALKEFWDEFYGEHQDLRPARRLVTATFNDLWPQLENMKRSDAKQLIANTARQEILSYTKAFTPAGSDATLPQGRAVVEGGPAAGRPRREAGEEEYQPTTLTDVLKARRAARYGKALKPTG